jgi:hypothetical protein
VGSAEHLEKASYVRTLQTRTADMHDCQLDCQLGSVVQHRGAPDRTLSSHKQSPRYALRRNGAPPGGLPLSLLALSHQPVVTHSNYTCAMLASPAHHAPRLDASRRTPGALHPEPEFNVSGHFADELLFYFLIAREHDDAYHCRRSLSAGPWTWSQANCSR